jgi:uncharacterized protein (TIGR03435 family)
MRRIAQMLMLGMAVMPAASQTPTSQKPAFEVASIKLEAVRPGITGFRFSTGKYFFRISGTRIVDQFATLTDLIMDAYNVKNYQILGAPDWATQRGDRYDITAKATGETAPSVDQVRLMFQALLAERFQLMLHRETKDQPVYELVIGKNGRKLRDIPADAPRDYVTQGPKLGTRILRGPVKAIVDLLSPMLDRPLIDKTGLTGLYEYSTDWAQADLNMNLTRPTDQTGPSGSIFTAVEEQLGLKLQPAKGSVEFLVINSVQKPTEN